MRGGMAPTMLPTHVFTILILYNNNKNNKTFKCYSFSKFTTSSEIEANLHYKMNLLLNSNNHKEFTRVVHTDSLKFKSGSSISPQSGSGCEFKLKQSVFKKICFKIC
jgi:hypothetical protein